MAKSVDCLVLGAGIVGVSTALQLQAHGREVALVDRETPGEGTSFGNAGIIQAEAIVPYMLPLDFGRLMGILLDRRSEARVHKAALVRLAPWLIRYLINSLPSGIERGIAAHRPLVERCLVEHEALIDAAGAGNLLRRTGYMKLFHGARAFEKEVDETERLKALYGIRSEALDNAQVSKLEPHLTSGAAGAILFTDAATSLSDPLALTQAYTRLFIDRGGSFFRADANALQDDDGRWNLVTKSGAVSSGDVVVTLGPWSADFLSRFGVRSPMAVKRGYHMHYRPTGQAALARPVLDTEAGFVLAPMARGIRLTTGAEFAFRDAPPTPRQLQAVEPVARSLFPLGSRVDRAPWLGARPCLPDMIPAIGPIPGKPGLWANFAHHHLGLTLGPVSGRLLAELMTGKPAFTDPAPYRPERY